MLRPLDVRFMGVRPKKLVKFGTYFLPLLRKQWRILSGAVLCGLGAVLMTLLRPWPIKLIFDDLLLPVQAEGRGMGAVRLVELPDQLLLGVLCSALLVVSIAWGFFSYGQAYLTARAGQNLVHELRLKVHSHLQRLSLNFHHRQRRGDLLMRLTGDINMLRDMLVNALVMAVSSLLLLVAMLSVLAWMDWRLALVIVTLLPLLALATFRFSAKIRWAAQRQRRKEGRIAAAINETLEGIRFIQAFGRERLQDKRFQASNRRSLRGGLRVTRLEASMARTIELVLAAGTAAVLWYGVRRVQAGALSPGDLLVFVSYAASSFKPMRRLARASSRTAKAVVCAERIKELLREPTEIRNRPEAVPIKKRQIGAIEFRRVSFTYPGKDPSLRKISFTVEPGGFVAVVGPSGSGKSTLLSLLLRLFEPSRGRILFAGKDLRTFTIDSLRNQMSVVLQEPFLFGDSIERNVGFAKPEASEVEIARAVKRAHVSEFSRHLPTGLQTSIAEAGASLSAGQRQRIAVARAFLRKAPVLLLDEPTTGLDAGAEIKVMAALADLMAECTTLMVAHKLATIQSADLIVVLRRGKVIEQGSHSELLAAGGWYARTWDSQAKEYPGERLLPYGDGLGTERRRGADVG